MGNSPYTTTIHILDALIHLLPANYSAPVAFIDAPARDGHIFFSFAVPNRDMESQLVHMCIMTVTPPNLHFPNLTPQATFSVPQLLQFMGRTGTSDSSLFDCAEFEFDGEGVYALVNPSPNFQCALPNNLHGESMVRHQKSTMRSTTLSLAM